MRSGKEKRVSTVVWYWVLGGMISISTLAYSLRLLDASNVVRYVTVTFGLLMAVFYGFRREKSSKDHGRCYVVKSIGFCCFVLFVLFQGVSMLWAPNLGEALYDFSKWLLLVGVIITFYNLFRRNLESMIELMANVSMVIFVISFVVALVQIGQTFDFSWNGRYRVVSLFTHKGTFAMMMFLLIPFPMMRICLCKWKGCWKDICVVVGALAVILFLQSRAVLLSMMCGLVGYLLLFVLRRCRSRLHTSLPVVFIFTIIVGVLVVGGCRWFANRETPTPDNAQGIFSSASVYERQAVWKMTFHMVDNKPWLGCGVGNWKICHPNVSTQDVFSIDVLDHAFVRPHNDYLRILSETGYIALFLLLFSMCYMLVDAFAFLIGNHSIQAKLFRIGLAFVVGTFVFALFDFPFDRIEILVWVGILVGFVMTIIGGANIPIRRIGYAFIGILSVCMLAFGVLRLQSEIHCAKAVNNMAKGRWRIVEQESILARSEFSSFSTMGVPLAYYSGIAQEIQGRSPLKSFLLAYKDAPYYKQTLNDLGRIEYVENHDVEMAEQLLKEAIRISPMFSHPYFNLANMYILEGRRNDALQLLNSLDLDKKQRWIGTMVWSFLSGEEADYYNQQLVLGEKQVKDELLKRATICGL